ncbi:hypothetical protein N7495_008708 [Penicillium taxi]|uniref:uncharacterized protein n=1 Tax=Penicillium taxi TaxID=168475 RepID=UPI002545143D|nr:uncharacterized protein N7495_008708 [Penicillium taxi]KAJ5888667.1 hypothetical protein N7495_008708 [Penicillium taxi]
MNPSRPLTLIVATTPIRVTSTETRLGIGLKGTLPWQRIKSDMSFFARVTTRPPITGKVNAIIMGRKTYDSVPSHLRPLAKRISLVITRDTTGSVKECVASDLAARKEKLAAKAQAAAAKGSDADSPIEPDTTDAIVAESLDKALAALDAYGPERLGKIFIIGGAEIYGAALRMSLSRPVRLVMTNVVRKAEGGAAVPFECDTFFPLDEFVEEGGWRSVSPTELTEWVGEEVSGEWNQDGEVEVQMVGYERLN